MASLNASAVALLPSPTTSIAAPTVTAVTPSPALSATPELATATVHDRVHAVFPGTTMHVSLRELDMHVGPSIPKESPQLLPATTGTAFVPARVHRRSGNTEARGKYRFQPYKRPSHVKKPGRAAGCSVKPAAAVSASAFLGSPAFASRGNADGFTPVSESDEIEPASEHAAESGGGGGSGASIWGQVE